LDLDFAKGVYALNGPRLPAFPTGWSFSRTDTNGIATALDLAGNVIQFATGVPRTTNRGILVEEARTNLLVQSQAFDDASWAKNLTTASANATTAPDGTTSADKIAEAAGTAPHFVATASTVSVVSGQAYTLTVFAKASERSFIALYESTKGQGKYFDLANGTVLGNLVAAPDSATIDALANGWYRCRITITTAAVLAVPSVYLSPDGTSFSYAGAVGSGVFLWGAQLELGAFATSPIITTGAAGTRGVDLPSQPFDLPAAYTIMSDAEVTVAQAGRFPTVVSTSGANNGLFLNGSNTPGFNLSNGTYNAFLASPVTAGTIVRHAARAETNNVRGAINGTLTTLGTSFTPITGSRIVYIGSNIEVSGRFNGYIRRIRILPTATADGQLQALTAP
jgi:hypothetical protein